MIGVLVAANLLFGTIAATQHHSTSARVASAAGGGQVRGSARASSATGTSAGEGTTSSDSASDSSDTSTTVSGDSTATTGSSSSADGSSGGEPPATEPPATEPPTTAPSCHNSHDPACGAFVWSPAPVNTPLRWNVTVDPAQPTAGQPVTFHVVLSDDEGYVSNDFACYGDTSCLLRTDFGEFSAVGYGPWTAPLHPSSTAVDHTHTYAHPGTYTATFPLASYAYGLHVDCPGDASQPAGSDGYVCRDPYLEFPTAKVTITVNA